MAVLANTEESSPTSRVTNYFAIDPDSLHLQAGWIRGDGGSGYRGRQWAGNLDDTGAPCSYLAASVSPEQWAHHAGIVEPPSGAAEVWVWLLDFSYAGSVCLYDIVFVQAGPPR